MQAHEGISWPFSIDRVLDKLSGNRWLPLAANIVALVLLVYGLSQWTWRLLRPATPAVVSSRAPDASQAPVDIQTLLTAHLFGQAPSTIAGNVNPERLPLSSLNIVLTGVIAQGKSSFAFVSINGAPENPVMIGQEITAGAVLEAVHRDRIVLRRGTSLESVLLKDSDATLPAGAIVTGRPDAASAIRSLGGGSYSVDRQTFTQNLTAETLSQATVAPGAGGLVVREVQSGGMFDKLGLRAGDIVRSVNGQPVSSLDDLAKTYAQFAATPQSARVTVEVVRSGKTEVLQYQMQ